MSRRTGGLAEEAAAEYLRQLGFKILEQNKAYVFGELDIVARDGSEIVFVEVKYRQNGNLADAIESVSIAKQRRLIKAAEAYLLSFRKEPKCRFDVVAVTGSPNEYSFEHIKDAFWIEA
jgi:putative endonuclease